MSDLKRFLEAQEDDYTYALQEVKNGCKESHWMWYIFPQIIGLGFSYMAEHYAIQNLQEAREYLKHPVLGKRLREISKALLDLTTNDAEAIFGYVDALKLRSSMTLFSFADKDDLIFQEVLDKFYGGERDQKTIDILAQQNQKSE